MSALVLVLMAVLMVSVCADRDVGFGLLLVALDSVAGVGVRG